MSEDLCKRLCGVIAGPVSPFRGDLSLDLDGLERLVDTALGHGFPALLIAGGIAEFHALTPDEVVESVHLAVRASGGRALIIGTVGVNAAVGGALARRLEEAGAGALLVLPPYYTNAPEAGLLDYYRAISNASGLPLIPYSRDWALFTPEMVLRLAETVPTLAAWKDGQGDIRRYQRIMRLAGDRLLWLGGAGDDCAPGYFAIGVAGYTSSLSNLLPKLALRIGAAGAARDFDELNRLVNRYVHPVFRLREKVRGYEVAVLKRAMAMFGLPAGPVRPPLPRLSAEAEAELEGLRGVLAEML